MKHTKGFTLLELMLAISILLIVMLMINQMFTSAQAIYSLSASRAEVFSQGRLALDVIETDLQTINPELGDLIMRSYKAEGVDELDDEKIRKQFLDLKFTRLPDNKSTTQIHPLMAFFTTTSWLSPKTGEYESGPAQVVYYLRRRPKQKLGSREYEMSGAYLMRRVIPYRVFFAGSNTKELREVPPEEEVAHSVMSAQVYAVNNGAVPYMLQQNKPAEFFSLLDETPTSDAALLRDDGLIRALSPTIGGDNYLNFARPKRGSTYSFGEEAGSVMQNLTTRSGYPLAIGVELTFINNDFEIIDGEFFGTVRTISKIISVPNSQAAVFLDQNDILKFNK